MRRWRAVPHWLTKNLSIFALGFCLFVCCKEKRLSKYESGLTWSNSLCFDFPVEDSWSFCLLGGKVSQAALPIPKHRDYRHVLLCLPTNSHSCGPNEADVETNQAAATTVT